jgi:hypothetical protein
MCHRRETGKELFMNNQLRKAFDEVASRPDQEQEAIARIIVTELAARRVREEGPHRDSGVMISDVELRTRKRARAIQLARLLDQATLNISRCDRDEFYDDDYTPPPDVPETSS